MAFVHRAVNLPSPASIRLFDRLMLLPSRGAAGGNNNGNNGWPLPADSRPSLRAAAEEVSRGGGGG